MKKETNDKNRELEKINLEIDKLSAEIVNLTSKIRYIPVVSTAIAILVFGFGVYQFYNQYQEKKQQQKDESKQSQENFDKNIELSEKEFRRKYYEKQLEIYLDLSKTAAEISTRNKESEIQDKYNHFLEIYYGNLIIVTTDTSKNQEVTIAADNFQSVFKNYKKKQASKDDLQTTAKKLSVVLRNSLIKFWKIPVERMTFLDE